MANQNQNLTTVQAKTKKKKNTKVTIIVWSILCLIFLCAAIYLGGGYMAQIAYMAHETSPIEESPKIPFYKDFSDVWKFVLFKDEYLVYSIICSIIVFILLLIAALYLNYRIFGKRQKSGYTIAENDTYGSADWMSNAHKQEILNQYKSANESDEIILGANDDGSIVTIPADSFMNRHIAIFGASGSGKSRCFARPYMFQGIKRGESFVVTDPKGELYESMAQYFIDNGYDVKMLNLKELQYSNSWNCLLEIASGDVEVKAQIFADTIIKNATVDPKGDFWEQCEMSLLKALCLYVVCVDDPANISGKNFGSVYTLLSGRSAAQLDEMFDNIDTRNPYALSIKLAYNTFKNASDTVKGGVLIGLASKLAVFQSKTVRSMTNDCEISLTKPGKQKCAYFCITSDQHGAYNFLAVLFYSMMFINLVEFADSCPGGHCPVPVNFLLDEFPNIGAIPDFTKKISTVRSRHINISVIFQNIAQLQNRYPYGQWEEILGNCDTQIFLGCADDTTAEYISNKTGVATIEVKSESRSREALNPLNPLDYKQTESTGKRNLLTPDEVLRYPGRKEIVFLRGEPALALNKYDYSLHPDTKRLREVKVQDYTPEWRFREDAQAAEYEKKRQEREQRRKEEEEDVDNGLQNTVPENEKKSGKKKSGSGLKGF